jgi:hypothetical protein
MKRELRVFHSFAEAEAADRANYRSLTPEQRLEILFEMIAAQRDDTHEDAQGVRALVESLVAANVRFVVAGGYAVCYHGHPRYTGDIDILIARDPENTARVAAALRAFGAPDSGVKLEDLVQPDMVIQLGVPPNRIDVLTSIEAVEFEEAWASRNEAVLDGLRVPFLSRELLIRNERAIGRQRDLADVETLEDSGH